MLAQSPVAPPRARRAAPADAKDGGPQAAIARIRVANVQQEAKHREQSNRDAADGG